MHSGIEFVTILDDYLKNKGLSRKEFCISAGVPESTIATCKSRNVMPSVDLIAKVAQYMNVSLDWLVSGEQFDDADKNNVLDNPYSRRSILNRIEIVLRKFVKKCDSNSDFETICKTYLSNIVDYEVLFNWADGKTNLPENVLPEIAKKLKVSLSWLLTQEGNQDIDPNGEILGLAQKYPKVLKIWDDLDEEDKKFIANYIWAKGVMNYGKTPVN